MLGAGNFFGLLDLGVLFFFGLELLVDSGSVQIGELPELFIPGLFSMGDPRIK